MNLIDANEVEGALDPNDRNGDAHLVNHSLDLEVNFDAFSWDESHWSLQEQMLALLLDLALGDAAKVDLTDDEVLVVSVVHLLLKLELANFLQFLLLELSELVLQLGILLVADGNEPLPLALLLQTSLPHSFFLLLLTASSFIIIPSISLPISSEVFFSSLPKLLFLLLGNGLKSSSLLLYK